MQTDSQLRTSALVLFVLLLNARPLRAEAPAPATGNGGVPVVGVVGVVAVGGNADARDRAAVDAGANAAVRAAGWKAPNKALSKKESAGLLRCLEPGEPGSCIPTTLGMQGVHHALVVAAQKQQSDDGSPMLVLTGKLVVTEPQALIVRQRYCEHCTDDKISLASSELAQQLLEDLAVRAGRTILTVRSVPTGAQILLDGKAIGATDGIFNTYPGAHVVVIEKAGFFTQTLSIDATDGKTAEVSVALQPSQVSEVTREVKVVQEERSRTLPVALMGGGAVLVVASGALLYLGQQDGADDRYRYPRASAFGIAAGVTGLAAVGAGLYLWLRPSKRGAPTANAIPGGAAVGWTRTF